MGDLIMLIFVGAFSISLGWFAGISYARTNLPKWQAEQAARQELEDQKEYERLKKKYEK